MVFSQDVSQLFGTSGIRGKIGEKITSQLGLNIGKALSTYLNGEGSVVIGYDTRNTNKMLMDAVSSGLMECGCDVVNLGMVPTPVVGYVTKKLDASAGVMITASHNPSQDNGFKIWNKNGMAYTRDQEELLEEIVYNNAYRIKSWDYVGHMYSAEDLIPDYMQDLLDLVYVEKSLKVVVDCGSGAGSYLSPLILRMIGCDVLSLNCQPDGFFPGRDSEPNSDNLKDLMNIVRLVGADLGIAHDGDADRMVAVDENGDIADFDKILALISRRSGGTVVTTVDAGLCIDECLNDVDGKVIRSRVGDVFVAHEIVNNSASFGGEPSGTWIHPEFSMCPDGILSALKVIELVSNEGKLSELLAGIPDYPSIRKKIPCSKNDKVKVLKKANNDSIEDYFDDIKNVNTIDGVRITFSDDSWVLIRPSGTQDYIRITLESKSEDSAKELLKISKKFINDSIK